MIQLKLYILISSFLYILRVSFTYNASKDVSFHIEREIEEVMFNRHCDEMYKIKLKPVKTDNEQLMYMIKDRIEMMDRNSNVYKNYIIFEKLIDEHLKSGLEINDILNGIKKLEVVEIILDKSLGDEPQKIFESINSTGLDLSLADLIRNYLLMDNINQEALYEEYWLEIEKNVGYKNLGDFVINYLNSQISKSVNEKNAYHLFKKHCIENNLTCEDILKSLKRTSKYYGAFIGENKYYSAELTKYLSAFNTIKQTTVLPLLFKIFNDYEDNRINEESLSKVLNYLLTYLIRITACEISKNLSKFMKSMYDRVIDGKYNNYYERFVIFLNDLRANDRMPTDKEFRDALISKPLYKKNICKYLLSVIENSTKEHIDVSNLTIEHILPQKENAAVWRKEIGEDYDSVYDLYLHTLGNLTITGHNSELGTKSFNDKKKIIKDNSKANILNKDVLSVDRWNKTSILNRANNLIDILLDEFKYVEIHSNKNVKNELGYDLNSDIDFSNTKPIAFSFDGEFIKVNNWVDLLTKFIGIAYDLDTVLFVNLAKQNYSIPNATRVYISNDNRKLRKPKEIENSGIYFEANLSSNRVLSFIKFLLLEMGIDIDKFSFELSEGVFDLNDEASWAEGIIPVAKLFYNLVENLIALSKISSDEIEKLKTKEYTKSLFPLTDYPAIANNINDNMGNSTRKRYRSQSLNFNGVEIYISTQFFENDREAIIEWYKKH